MVAGPPPPSPKDGYAAYAQTGLAQSTGGGLERDALIRAAHLLEAARMRPDDAEALAKALRFNTELWTIFQADISSPGSRMSPAIRQDLLNLGLFMDRSTATLLAGADNATLAAMVDVNLALAGAG